MRRLYLKQASAKIASSICNNTLLYVRFALFLAFMGHGLVSLGFSPGVALHLKILQAANYTGFPTEDLLVFAGLFDIVIALLFLSQRTYAVASKLALAYLIAVILAVCNLYFQKTGSFFGIAEMLRRVSWIMLVIFLISAQKSNNRYHLLRLSSGFAFSAHGLASLGFFGFKQAHIEIASKIIPEVYVNDFILYSGFSDMIIGLALLAGIFTRFFALVGSFWVLAVVTLSSMIAIPDGMFRLGFFMIVLYNYLDPRTSEQTVLSFVFQKKDIS